MWFKRRKKTEQTQALSQSLRSLQSLLNENDERREPSLDSRHEESGRGSSETVSAPRRVPAASPAGDHDDRPDSTLREPTPPDSASRWRDLNLSFDAEPVIPRRARRGTEVESDEADDDTDTPPAQDLAGEPDQAVPAEDDAPAAASTDDAPEPILDDEQTAGNAGEEHVQATPDIVGIDVESFSHAPPVDPEPAAPDPSAETEPDAEPDDIPGAADPAPEAAAANDESPDQSPGESPGIEWEEPKLPDIEVTEETPGPGSGDERKENQLHLELEPADNTVADDDIPTLTEAVYVPDTPSAVESAGGDPDPAPAATPDAETPTTEAPPPDADVERCVDQLRTRLQLMDLDTLSPEQEAQLRDTLEAFLEELRDGGRDR